TPMCFTCFSFLLSCFLSLSFTFFFYSLAHLLHLHSFPTRRSSDLFASILDKQLGRYRQSHAFSHQILPHFLLLSVSLPLVFLLYACVHLRPYNLTIASLNRKSMFPAPPCLYISLYSIDAYPQRLFPLVWFWQELAIHLKSFACYVLAGREISHIKHRPLATCVSLIGIPVVENLSHSLYRQIYTLRLYRLLLQLAVVFLMIDRCC